MLTFLLVVTSHLTSSSSTTTRTGVTAFVPSVTATTSVALVVRMVNQDEGPIFYNDFEEFEDDEQQPVVASKKVAGDPEPQPSSRMILGTDDVASSDGDTTASEFVNFLQERRSSKMDWTAIQTRQFSLGQDLVLSNYVGNMGFDEVTDWEYYLQSEDGDDDREVVQPNPFDKSKYVTSII